MIKSFLLISSVLASLKFPIGRKVTPKMTGSNHPVVGAPLNFTIGNRTDEHTDAIEYYMDIYFGSN